MKKILIPTDLSVLGDFAYSIAETIASATGASIDVLSIVPGPQGAIYDMQGKLRNDDGEDVSEWTKRLDHLKGELVKWCAEKKKVSSFFAKIGRVEDDIIYYAENNNIDLIIMGTKGAHGFGEWMRGSHTEHITNYVTIPVLSVKCDRSNLDLTNMVFVSDFLEAELLDLHVIKEIQHAFEAKFQLLHIKTPAEKLSEEEIKQNMEQFVTMNGLNNYHLNVYPARNVEKGIESFLSENALELIILGTHQRKGLGKLFRLNISDDIVNHLQHPILTFPI